MIKKLSDNKVYFFFVAILMICLISKLCYGSLDYDFYHIASSGEWIVENKAIMYENEFFVADGYKTITQQWLYSVLLYLSYAWQGFVGVKIFVAIQFAVLVLLMYKLLNLFKIDKRTIIFVITATVYVMGYINCRPQIISMILIYSELLVLEKYKQSGKKGLLYLLPLTTLAEINLHCTFWIFHFIFILPYLVPFNALIKKLIGKDTKVQDNLIGIKPLIIPMLLMVASLFINPYGIDGIMCLFYSYGLSLLEIGEMQNVQILSVSFLFIVIGVLMLMLLYKKKRLTSSTLYVTVGTALLYVIATRNRLFYSVAVLYLIKDLLKDVNLDKFYNFFNKVKSGKTDVLINSVAVCFIVVFAGLTLKPSSTSSDNQDSVPRPCKAIEYLKSTGEDLSSIKMFTDFNSGSFLQWNGVGKIYLGAKTEPYFKKVNGVKDIISEYAFIQNYATQSDIKSFLEEYDFDYLYVPDTFASLQVYLEDSPDYECVVIGDTYSGTTYYQEYEIAMYRLYKKVN
jgi:hypothetical protein